MYQAKVMLWLFNMPYKNEKENYNCSEVADKYINNKNVSVTTDYYQYLLEWTADIWTLITILVDVTVAAMVGNVVTWCLKPQFCWYQDTAPSFIQELQYLNPKALIPTKKFSRMNHRISTSNHILWCLPPAVYNLHSSARLSTQNCFGSGKIDNNKATAFNY